MRDILELQKVQTNEVIVLMKHMNWVGQYSVHKNAKLKIKRGST